MENRGIKRLGKGFVRFTSFLNGVATIWTFLIMFLMTGDVLGRTLFNHPITGTPELVKVSIVGIIFMHMAHTLWGGRHIRCEIILARLSPLRREALQAIMFLFGAAVFVGIVVSSWPLTINSWEILEWEGEGALRVPTYPIRTLILLGSTLTGIIFLFRFIESILFIKKTMRGDATWTR